MGAATRRDSGLLWLGVHIDALVPRLHCPPSPAPAVFGKGPSLSPDARENQGVPPRSSPSLCALGRQHVRSCRRAHSFGALETSPVQRATLLLVALTEQAGSGLSCSPGTQHFARTWPVSWGCGDLVLSARGPCPILCEHHSPQGKGDSTEGKAWHLGRPSG